MKRAMRNLLCMALCFATALSAPGLYAARALGEAAAVLPPHVVSSDGALPDANDYYAWHPDEDPVFDAQDMQAQIDVAANESGVDAAGVSGYSYVRILLSTAGSLRDVTISGNYSLQNAAGAVCALPASGSIYRFSASGATVTVSLNGAIIASGSRFTLQEHTPVSGMGSNSLSLYNSAYGARSYTGDLIVYAQSGALRFVNRVYIEDYLCGVVGGEIGDSSPMESLKAQAVAARSYAVKSLSPSAAYDMLDTSASQVYKGICSSEYNVAAAVAATARQVLIKNGSVITGLYSSSNGGEKDTSRNRWSGDPAWGGEAVAADTPDLIYSINYATQKNNSYYEQAVFPANGAKTAATNALITHSLLPLLISRGYCTASTTAESVALSGLSMSYTPMPKTDGVTYLSYLHVRYMGSVNGVPFDVTDSIYYTQFYVAQGWGLFSNGSLNQYWIGTNGGNYVLRHARRGHGIGLSQIGARQRALNGDNYASILSFYYDGAAPIASPLIGDKELTARRFVYPKGDVDQNGVINVTDALLLCRFLSAKTALTSTQAGNADVNLDGAVTLADAVLICRYIAGIL